MRRQYLESFLQKDTRCSEIVENDKQCMMRGCLGLHKDVDIKIGIIYKNR